MSVDQTTITLGLALAVTLLHSCLAHYRKKRLTIDSVAMFALLCAGIVTGVYLVIGAFKVHDRNSLYSGVFGVGLAVVSAQKVILRFEAVCRRPPGKNAATQGQPAD
ncbi:MAG TPA: hypothetical protein VNX26_17730 [Candidatus Acidoferrum sp.]|nr:hypothetical protein [Candidatus Acidoferrum sp.]